MINLLTLGRTSIAQDGEELAWLAAHKQKMALLAYLAVEAPVMRDRLVGTFWPERHEDKARHSLSQALYALKKELGTECFIVSGDRIELTPGQLSVDVKELEDAAEGGRWETAAGLYEGQFLEGFYLPEAPAFDQWLTNTRAWVARLARRAFAEVIRARTTGGGDGAALDVATRWATLEPMEDEAQHALIALLARSGDRAEALRRYAAFCEHLSGDDLEPLDGTRDLVSQIRSGEMPRAVLLGDEEFEAAAETEEVEPAVEALAEVEPPPGEQDVCDVEGLLRQELGPRFGLEGRLGQSPTSCVYRAREQAPNRWLAIKVISPALADNSRARMRFEREVQAVASLNHPNIVTLHWAGTLSNDLPYFAMQYVRGRTLAEKLESDGRLSVEEARRVAREVASALALAHRRDIVHRDLQPANILLDEESGRAILADFGIAAVLATAGGKPVHITGTGEILGDPTYVSPEQLRDGEVTDRSDIYGLGLLTYEMLTGCSPYDAKRPQEMWAAHFRASPRPLSDFRDDVDESFERLIVDCLAKEPERRPSASQVIGRLDEAELESPSPEPRPSWFTDLVRRRVPHVLAIFAPAGFLVVELVGQLEAEHFLPVPAHQLTLVTYLVGLPGVTVGAWFHGEEGRQQRRRLEICWYGILIVIWLAACGLVLFG